MYKILIFTKKDLKIIIIATSIGSIVQYFCWKYTKNHPEIFEPLDGKNSEEKKPIEKPIKGPLSFSGRGGEIISVTGVQIVLNLGKLVLILKGYGTVIFLGTAVSILTVKKIPTTAISTTVRFIRKKLSDGSPLCHTDWEKGHTIEINYLEECNYDFKYLVSTLSNKEIPYRDRQKKALIILKKQLNFETKESLIRFITCAVSVITLLTILGDTTSIFLMMQNLLEVLREGKISKRVARILIRRFRRKGVKVDPELMEAAKIIF